MSPTGSAPGTSPFPVAHFCAVVVGSDGIGLAPVLISSDVKREPEWRGTP